MNSNPYTFLGNRPLNLAPDADLDHGLSVITFRTMAFGAMIGAVISALGRGSRLRRDRRIDYRSDLDGLVVSGHGSFPYQVDGDYLGEVDRLEFRHEPDRLSVVMPGEGG
jgi:diacylglycerol kinase family enzyme